MELKLPEEYEFMRDNWRNALKGEYQNLDNEYINFFVSTGFICENLSLDERGMKFEYDDVTIRITTHELQEMAMTIPDVETTIISIIRTSEDFSHVFKSVLRDKKIDDLLNDSE